MEIILRNIALRRVLIFLEILGFVALLIVVSRKLVAARLAARTTVADIKLAIKLDPRNSAYQLRMGRLLQNDLNNINPNQAEDYLKRAAEIDSYSPRPWIDLGAILEFQGKTTEAELCLRRADLLAPNLTSFQWTIGNFFLLHGNIDDAFRAFKKVLAGTNEYDRVLFDTAWKASGDGRQILDTLIPNRVSTEFSYLNYLDLTHHYVEAQSVWQRIAASSENYPANYATVHIHTLINLHRSDQAYQVWTDLRAKGLISPLYEETSKNLVINGDFEEDIINMGFDWRIVPVDGVYVGIDRTNFHSPSQALEIQFTGKQNVNFRGINQYVRVEPGRSYQLRGFIKTEGITTDSGIRLEVNDAYDGRILDRLSDNIVGSTTGWNEGLVNFETSPQTNLVVVGVSRRASEKLDNLISGKVWVDDISLIPTTPN